MTNLTLSILYVIHFMENGTILLNRKEMIMLLMDDSLTHKVTILKTGETGFVETVVEDQELCGQLEKLRTSGH